MEEIKDTGVAIEDVEQNGEQFQQQTLNALGKGIRGITDKAGKVTKDAAKKAIQKVAKAAAKVFMKIGQLIIATAPVSLIVIAVITAGIIGIAVILAMYEGFTEQFKIDVHNKDIQTETSYINEYVIDMADVSYNVELNNYMSNNVIKIADNSNLQESGGQNQKGQNTTLNKNESQSNDEQKSENTSLNQNQAQSNPVYSNALESSTNDLKNMVSFTPDGMGYVINDNYALNIIRALEKSQVDTLAVGFRDKDYDFTKDNDYTQTYTRDEDLKNVVDKYIRAELKSMLPYIDGATTAINGVITVKRYTSKYGRYDDKGITLKYVPYSQLLQEKRMGAGNHSQIQEYLTHFSINPENFKLCILVSTEDYIWRWYNDGNPIEDPNLILESADSQEATFELKEYEYLNLVEQVATPINYFIAMHLLTQNPNFMEELVDSCNRNNSTIEIGFLETSSASFTNINYVGNYQVEEFLDYNCQDIEEEPIYNDEGEVIGTHGVLKEEHSGTDNHGIVDRGPLTKPEINELKPTLKDWLHVVIQNSGDIYLTRADTWMMDLTLDATLDIYKTKINVNVKKEPYPIDPRMNWHKMAAWGPEPTEHGCGFSNPWAQLRHNTYYNVTEITTTWGSYYVVYYTKDGGYKLEYIMQLIKKYPDVENRLTNAGHLLFTLLEQNGNTQEHEHFMRYVITRLSGYGYLTEDRNNLNFDFAVGISDDALMNYTYDGNIVTYTPDGSSSASSSGAQRKSGGVDKTRWHLEKHTTITTTDQDGNEISKRTYSYFKQESGTNICGRTSLATCLSGLGIRNPSTGQPYTPTEISPNNTDQWFSWARSACGVKTAKYTNGLAEALVRHLSTGDPAIVHVKPNSGTYSTGYGHFIAVVGVKVEGDKTKAYVLDPGSSKSYRTENYIDIKTILQYADDVRTFSR